MKFLHASAWLLMGFVLLFQATPPSKSVLSVAIILMLRGLFMAYHATQDAERHIGSNHCN